MFEICDNISPPGSLSNQMIQYSDESNYELLIINLTLLGMNFVHADFALPQWDSHSRY